MTNKKIREDRRELKLCFESFVEDMAERELFFGDTECICIEIRRLIGNE